MASAKNVCLVGSSVLGTLAGLSAFICFFCFYGNIKAGTWAMLSSVFAAVTLQLHLLHVRDKLEDYHSVQTLQSLLRLGLVVALLSAGFTAWYIFSAVYWPVAMADLKDNAIITTVWCFMTAKWGALLAVASRRYQRMMGREAAPLLRGS